MELAAALYLGLDDGSGAAGSAPLTTSQVNAIIEEVRVYADSNIGGVFDVGTDVIATVAMLALDARVNWDGVNGDVILHL